MSTAWVAVIVALVVWWFSTGAILAIVKRADRGGRDSHLWAVLLALPVLVLGAGMFADTLHRTEPGAIYAGFFAALMIWGWIEMAFLCGIITGPNRRPTTPSVPERERFLRAFGTVAHHELLLLACLLVMGSMAQGAANPFGFWTFAVLFGARISAKLNLFYGVPRINTEFLPRPLAHLPSHFRTRRCNWLFPISVTALSFVTAVFLERTVTAVSVQDTIGFALLSALAGLALLEHWLMVVPLPDAKLWRWMLPDPNGAATRSANDD